jgi:hypothetical protein
MADYTTIEEAQINDAAVWEMMRQRYVWHCPTDLIPKITL